MKKLVYISLLFFTFISATITGQNVAIKAILDTNYLLIGEQTHLHFIATYSNQNTQVTFPTFSDTIIKEIEVLTQSKIDSSEQDENGLYSQSLSLLITSFDSGYYVIPPYPILINNDTIETDALLLEVQSVEVDTSAAIFDIKQPLPEPFSIIDWLKDNWIWLTAILLAALGIYFLIRY